VSRARAEAVAARLLAAEDFAVPVNADVLRELNRLVGTPEGRALVRIGRERMKRYRPMVERKMRQYGVPSALLAVPFVESAWRNLKPQPPDTGVGLWQFVGPTARAYGLRVDANVDERLEPAKATDAAMRLLAAHRRRFRSWALSVVAYNGGEGATRRAIARVGRDPWKVVAAGAETERGYLAKVFAAALVLAEPTLLR
jgi:membrane-bound lytic murein transglycosylase D